ncbi:MAG TPA: hypothetical protein VGA55_07395 [Bacteroidota bacterium]
MKRRTLKGQRTRKAGWDPAELILETWAIHNAVTVFLVGKIPAKGFSAVPSGPRVVRLPSNSFT